MTKENYTMLCDFYELTMANGYFEKGMQDQICYFDVFFRKIPDGGGYAICCGLDSMIEYIENLKFTDEDIEYLRSKNFFLCCIFHNRNFPKIFFCIKLNLCFILISNIFKNHNIFKIFINCNC